ncbi:ATP-binding protein [Natrialbaceae archaeon AArc-T1-2]|uniref:ATP-binding protein n=1 Tax=Natrialbaceae archaeon AArc-T1-2 TaxID=3053904 RepID=UPI00255AC5CA|nr:ATP-binding protein [Natrialbaceae archaeon AArc-T1-2]WIV67482.1 ATP-binding protein [Natrialbaceae archaeon AArc-T1-2]
MERHRTPFPAIVGQEELKRALLAVAANDALDGLLVQGEKGTAKSTAVRGLVDLLPDQRVVADCPYGCPPDDPAGQCAECRERDREDLPVESRPVPLVTLPLGATRERVVGTLSVADALEGEAEFDPGLLARANRGILYVDEVNLLEDHLVDVILDAAASGVNRVERDGVSVEHPADFTLIGTMNPEEGELRPQLRDRFALQATVVGCREIEDRVEIIDRALAAGTDPDRRAAYAEETAALRDRLLEARTRLPDVELPAAFRRDAAELCLEAGVDGHRGDIAIAHTARTLAALDGREKVIEPDVEEAARLALPHRLQSRPFEDEPDLEDVLEDQFDDESDREDEETDASDTEAGEEGDDERGSGSDDAGGDDRRDGHDGDGSGGGSSQPSGESPADDDGDGDDDSDGPDEGEEEDEATPLVPGQQRADIGDAETPPVEEVDAGGSPGDGSRARVDASRQGRGSRVRTERAGRDDTVDAAASIRAAAGEGRTDLESEDLRTSVRTATAGTLVVFVVDASASMGPAMSVAKGTVMSLLQDAYERRDEVAFVAVAGEESEVLLPPTDSVTLAARHLKELPTGDRTPLPSGLEEATRLVTRSEADASLVVVVTDGRANVAEGSPTAATREAAGRLARTNAEVVLVDASEADDRTGLIGVLEAETDGRTIPLASLSAEKVAEATRSAHE